MNLIHDFQRYKINTITISYTLIASFSQGIWLWIDNVCRNNFKVPIEIMVGFDLSLTIFHSMLMKINQICHFISGFGTWRFRNLNKICQLLTYMKKCVRSANAANKATCKLSMNIFLVSHNFSSCIVVSCFLYLYILLLLWQIFCFF